MKTGNVRERIIRASMRVFSTYGFFRAPISMIAKEAGVSKGLIFWYFRSKDELVLEVAYRSLPLDILQECLSENKEGVDLLKCIGWKYFSKYKDPVLRNLLLHTFSAGVFYPQIGEKIRSICEKQLREVARRVYGDDSVKSRVAMRTFFGSLLCYMLRPPSDISEEEYLDILIKILSPRSSKQ